MAREFEPDELARQIGAMAHAGEVVTRTLEMDPFGLCVMDKTGRVITQTGGVFDEDSCEASAFIREYGKAVTSYIKAEDKDAEIFPDRSDQPDLTPAKI